MEPSVLDKPFPAYSDLAPSILSQIDRGDYALLEAEGLICPEPVMLLHKLVKQLASESLIKVTADDDSTLRDIPRFCDFLRHTLLAVDTRPADGQSESRIHTYWISTRA